MTKIKIAAKITVSRNKEKTPQNTTLFKTRGFIFEFESININDSPFPEWEPVYGYSKTCLKWPLSKRPKVGFQNQLSLTMQVKSIADCSKGSILQYFRPSLSYHLSF